MRALFRLRPPPDTLDWVAGAIGRGASIGRVRPLTGGSSSAVHAIDAVDRRGARHRLVLRRYLRPEWRHERLPHHEARVLEALWAAGLPVPRAVAIDARPDVCDAPAVLMTRLPGRMVLVPEDMDAWLREQARPLPAIHAVPVPQRPRLQPFRPYYDVRGREPPDWSSQREAWRAVIDLATGPRPREPARFLHRDYHPANLLWQRGRISGVIDWVNACAGPAPVDVAHCRRNLAQMFNVATADRFLAAYQELVGRPVSDYDPYWDALLLLDGSLDASVFQGWEESGLSITLRQVRVRLDRFAVSIAKRC